jgi:hypothetical protein
MVVFVIVCGRRCDAEPLDDLTYGAFIDSYIAHDFNHLPSRYRAYSTQPYYSDEGALNLGFVEAALDSESYRGRVAFQYGSSVVENYARESHLWWRYVQEAYGGIKIDRKLSIDAGVFLSHIGTESWISRDNIALSRSLIADYSPYYESGVRARYAFSDMSIGELYIVRGWQNISNVEDPAVGTRWTRRFANRVTLAHSSFVGNQHGMRIFNAPSISYTVSARVKVIGEYDVGFQERRADTSAWWHGWALTVGFTQNSTLSWGVRAEYFSDPHQVMVTTLSQRRFQTFGASINLDMTVVSGLIWRNEYRALMSSEGVYRYRDSFSSHDQFVLSSLQYSFR